VTSAKTPQPRLTVDAVPTSTLTAPADRVRERRHAVAVARHYREFEGLSIAQIAERLGRSPATIKAYFYDPSDANKGPSWKR
jgi:AcrR family transcriptional regulator